MVTINRGLAVETAKDEPTTKVNAELCFCDKDLALDFLQLVLPEDVLTNGLFYRSQYPKIKGLSIETFLILLNQAMTNFEINTCLRKAHFLAQIACEGDMFRTTEEYKNRNGSIPSHWQGYRGGHEYHGRGLIQLTHIDNYRKYGATVGVEFNLSNLNLVASEPEHVINSAGWYWLHGSAWGSGNKYSDLDDIHYITMLVNGGFNHYCDRKRNVLNLIERMRIKDLCINANNLGNSLGVYNFQTSKLSRTRVGPIKWDQYHTNEKLRPYVGCESR